MTKKIRTPFCVLGTLMCTSFSGFSYAQDTKKIAGEYDNGFYIFDDNTFMVAGVNAIVFGTVEVKGNTIKLIKHQPPQKFALYGRKVDARLHGNTIMFRGFENNGLVNLSENNNPPNIMRRVFNKGANCFSFPNFYDNAADCKEIYFADENDLQIYKFVLPKGYRDFVAFRFDLENDAYLRKSLEATVAEDFNSISFVTDNKKHYKRPLSKDILETKKILMSMYERTYPEGKYYYCNPSFNIFEEKGIDISNYKELGNGEGVFQLIGSNQSEPTAENRLKFDYGSNEIIYRYERIEPQTVTNVKFSIDEKSIFTFVCEGQ